MANIKIYSPGTVTKAPNVSAESQGALSGQMLEKTGQEIGQAAAAALDFHTQMQTTKLEADFAEAQLALQQDLSAADQASDPNDMNFSEKWRAKSLEPALTKFRGQSLTPAAKERAAQMANQLNVNFTTRVNETENRRVGIATGQNAERADNASSAMIALAPSNYRSEIQATRDRYERFIADGKIDRNTANAFLVKAETGLAISAVKGWSDLGREDVGRALLKNGEFGDSLDGNQVAELNGYLDTQERVRRSEAKRMQEERSDNRKVEITRKMFQKDGSIAVTPELLKETFDDPNLSPTDRYQVFNFLSGVANDQATGKSTKSDPLVYADLSARVFLPVNDPRKATIAQVQNAYGAGRLSQHDLDWFSDKLTDKDPVTKEANKALTEMQDSYSASIGASGGMTSKPIGDRRLYDFRIATRKRFEEGMAAGIPASELLNKHGPKFVGKDWQTFQVTNKQAMEDMMYSLKGIPPPDEQVTPPAGNSQKVPVVVQSPTEAMALPPGTWYKTPDGRVMLRKQR